jgi:hypothetical protein
MIARDQIARAKEAHFHEFPCLQTHTIFVKINLVRRVTASWASSDFGDSC